MTYHRHSAVLACNGHLPSGPLVHSYGAHSPMVSPRYRGAALRFCIRRGTSRTPQKNAVLVIEITPVHQKSVTLAPELFALGRSECREVAMATAFKRRSSYGTECVQCGSELIAPEKSKYCNDLGIRHVWRCLRCDCCFEVISPADTKSIEDIMTRIEAVVTWDDVPPWRLVA